MERLSYQIALELKYRGFPQTRNDGLCKHGNWGFVDLRESCDCVPVEVATIPTLSELIEACGEHLRSLDNCGEQGWEAIREDDECGEPIGFEEGSTPEEAVARLWLALNKN
jgi:hypothetical protein